MINLACHPKATSPRDVRVSIMNSAPLEWSLGWWNILISINSSLHNHTGAVTSYTRGWSITHAKSGDRVEKNHFSISVVKKSTNQHKHQHFISRINSQFWINSDVGLNIQYNYLDTIAMGSPRILDYSHNYTIFIHTILTPANFSHKLNLTTT